MKYSLFDVILVWPNQSAGSFPKLRYLKIKNYHLHQKEYHFLPNLPYNNGKDEPATNSISYSKYKTVNCTLYCVKQFSLNFYTVFGLWWVKVNFGAKALPDVAETVINISDNYLDFYAKDLLI